MDKIDLVLKIIAWGIIAFVVSVIVLMALGIIHSPEFETLLVGWLTALSVEIIRLGREISGVSGKIDLIWSEFKKRKKI